MLKLFVENVFFAGTDMLITVLIPMGDGHWDAVLTVGRRNISGFHMPIKV